MRTVSCGREFSSMRPILTTLSGCAPALLLTALAPWETAAEGARTGTIKLDDVVMEASFTDPDLSPDGQQVAFVVRRASFADNRFLKTLYVARTSGGDPMEVTPAGKDVTSPQWSPDGARLAWIDAASGKLFISRSADRFADPVPLTAAPQTVSSLEWSPDGRTIAFLAPDPKEERAGEERFNRSFEAGEDDYLAVDRARPSHLWLVPVSGGAARRLTSGSASMADIEWMGDSRRILLVTQPGAELVAYIDQALEVIDTETGARSVLHSESHTLIGQNTPALSPDGRWIAFTHPLGEGRDTDYFPEGIHVMPATGGAGRNVAPTIDRNLVNMAWLPNSRELVLGAPDRTRFGLWVQPLQGKPRRIDLGAVAHLRDLVIGPRGQLAFVASEPNHPPEVFVMDSVDAKPRRLTHFNQNLAALEHGRIETIRWTSDGFEHDGVLFYPPDFDPKRKTPLVLALHGGPSDPISESWHGIHEDAFLRLMAAQGWLVFAPNYRGSGSQGLRYQSAIVNDPSEGPARDVMNGLAAVRSLGLVDEERMAICGYSYGGYMTAWLTAHHDLWRAAVAGAPVTDHFDWYNLADYNTTWGLGMNGSPWRDDNWKNYWQQSPIAHAHRIRAPTLILAGTHDRRVTITQAYKLYHALKDNDVPVKFIAYPDSGHWPNTPAHERDMYRRWLGWIAEHLSPRA